MKKQKWLVIENYGDWDYDERELSSGVAKVYKTYRTKLMKTVYDVVDAEMRNVFECYHDEFCGEEPTSPEYEKAFNLFKKDYYNIHYYRIKEDEEKEQLVATLVFDGSSTYTVVKLYAIKL